MLFECTFVRSGCLHVLFSMEMYLFNVYPMNAMINLLTNDQKMVLVALAF